MRAKPPKPTSAGGGVIGLSSTVTRPVLRYHGGKFRLAPWVIKHFPPHRCYVEPFGGAAGVLVQKDRAYAEVYNDLDGDIVNVFRVLRDRAQCDELIAQLLLTPYARDEFDAAYEPTTDPIERARRTLVRAEMGFGSAGATKGTTGFRIDTRRKHGTAQALWARFPESLARVCERLAGVMIENRPALSIIDQHDAEDTLFYVDPPYVMGTLFYVDPPYVMGTRNVSARHGRYYTCEMSDDEHVQLLDKLCSVRGMVVLSGYESALYLGALQGWSMASTEARISAARGTGIRTECLWLNPAASRALERTGLFEQVAA